MLNVIGRITVMGMKVFTVKFFKPFHMFKHFITECWRKYIIVVTIIIEKIFIPQLVF